MSLVGNLEDLSLGDILQIISLSQKSGVLALDADQGSGRVVFASGLVRGACVKGGVATLRDLLVRERLVDPSGFEALRARAVDLGIPVEDVLASEGLVAADRIDALVKAAIESAVFEMFRWSSGSFSFDVRSEMEPGDPELLLPHGVNAQYLAMEGMRLRDELARDGALGAPREAATSDVLDVGAPASADPFSVGDAFDAMAVDAAEAEVQAGEPEGSAVETLVAAVLREQDAEPVREGAPVGAMPAEATRRLPVIVIDPEVVVLDWVKAAIQDGFARVHVFQQAEQGLARIRQYLIRGEQPIVLLSPATPIDPLSGIHGLADFVKRLKTQAGQLRVIALREADAEEPVSVPSVMDGVLDRPPARLLRKSGRDAGDSEAERFLGRLQAELAGEGATPRRSPDRARGHTASSPTTSAGPVGAAPADLRTLREATASLQQASSRGEILPLVLDFAAGLFSRAAILAVRDEEVFAVAGRNMPALEVDPLASEPSLPVRPVAGGLLHRALAGGEGVRGRPDADLDSPLLARFGGLVPAEAYLAPIQGAGGVVALLYGDQGESDAALPDSNGLEVVLHHAGLALDRAALERALCEAEGR